MALTPLRRASQALATAACCAFLVCALAAPPASALGTTAKASVVAYLKSIAGTKIVSGQHNKEPASAPARYTQQVRDVTGVYPGLWGGDLMFRSDDIAGRQAVIDQAKTEWANGSLVALTWHACAPTVASSCEFTGGVKTSITSQQFGDVVTAGTTLSTTWRQRMAAVVPYLRQLKDAGIPVLWRPFHEMNESWNWWGGRPGVNGGAKIFQQMKDYFDSEGLDNLIWVWNVQDNPAGGWSAYYPGSAYVDVVSLDVWYKAHPSVADYQQLQAIAGNKPIALAEMGKVPTAALLAAQPQWSYFMMWSEQLRENNSDAEIRAAYAVSRVLTQGQLAIPGATPPSPPSGAISGPGGKCMDAAASGTANGTAVQLYACAPGLAQTWTIMANGTIRNPHSGKCLDVTGQGTANGTPLQLWDCNASPAQNWVYTPADQSLRNPQSGRCLDVAGQSTANGARLQIRDCGATPSQRWVLPG